jgi:hypothetical protein
MRSSRWALAFAFALIGCGGSAPPEIMGPSEGQAKYAADLAGVTPPDLDGAHGLPFGSHCTANSECESDFCNAYPAKGGSFCTNHCTAATAAKDCPPPSPGCNMMQACKMP